MVYFKIVSYGSYRETSYYDGVIGMSECGITPGSSFTYNVNMQQSGTYWIHSHRAGQYPDGLRTPLIIYNPADPAKFGYTQEYLLGLSDWYYEEHGPLYAEFVRPYANPDGLEPCPNSIVMNDAPKQQFAFTPGTTYRLRIVSMSTYATLDVWIDGHNMTIIECDGVAIVPYVVDSLQVATAQRYSVLVTAKPSSDFNYLLHYQLNQVMFSPTKIPTDFNPSATALLLYSTSAPTFNATVSPDPTLFDDLNLRPLEVIPAMKADLTIRMDAIFSMFTDFVNHGTFNGFAYVLIPSRSVYEAPIVPSLFTALSTGSNATNHSTYGPWAQSTILPNFKGVQVILFNHDKEGSHPFHLHGHNFQVLARGTLSPPRFNFDYSILAKLDLQTNPMRRDTIVLPKRGYVVLRFFTGIAD